MELSQYELLCMAEGITRECVATLNGVYNRSLNSYVSPREFKAAVEDALAGLQTLAARLEGK